MSLAGAVEPPSSAQTQLRLWPGIALVASQWLLRYALPLLSPDTGPYGVIGGVLLGLAILIWWLAFSQARWPDRLAAVALIGAGLALTPRFLHPSIATGMMGMMFPIQAIPLLCLALVIWAWASAGRNHSRPGLLRYAGLAALILAACAAWTLARTDGLIGEAGSQLAWRWTKTPEEQLLARSAPALPLAAPPAPAPEPAPAAPPPPAPAAKEEPPVPPPEPLSDVEKARLAELEGEWGDISEMLTLRDKVVKAKLEQEIADRLGKTVQELREGLAPIVQDHVSSRIEAHRAAILAAHPDSETVSPEVKKWIATQPAYLKAAMEQVYDAGTTQDVIDLFSRFKKETGRAAPQEPHPTPGAKPTEPAPPAARDDSSAALEHVRSRRVTPAPEGRGGPAKDDYDAAWDEATAS